MQMTQQQLILDKMAEIDIQYKNLAEEILRDGYTYMDESRKQLCQQVSDHSMKIDLSSGFPLITTKKMFTKGIVTELLWFLRAETNIFPLVKAKVGIWDKDAYRHYERRYISVHGSALVNRLSLKEFILRIATARDTKELEDFQSLGDDYTLGDLGKVYGSQWRNWSAPYEEYISMDPEDGKVSIDASLDQIQTVLDNVKVKPIGRRHIVTAWNPAEINDVALPPCHWAWEIISRPLKTEERIKLYPKYVIKAEEKKSIRVELHAALDSAEVPTHAFALKWHQRSVDTFLGLPFNITSYAVLSHIMGRLMNMIPETLIADLSNVHFYKEHIPSVKVQLERDTSFENCNLVFSQEFEQKLEFYKQHNDLSKFFDSLVVEDFIFENYVSHDAIKDVMFEPLS
jgi:thymidylate synthase